MPDRDYYSAVEHYFVSLRGSPLFITPKEWALVHRWRSSGIPIRVVQEGLDRALGARGVGSLTRPPRPGRAPVKLGYCRQTIEATYRRLREALAGSTSRGHTASEEGPAQLIQFLLRAERALSTVAAREGDNGLGQAAARCEEQLLLARSRPNPGEDLGELERELDYLDRQLTRAAEEELAPVERRSMREVAEQSLESYRPRMPEEVFRSATESVYLKSVRERFGLPALSLFYW
jgi:hypothetical protein